MANAITLLRFLLVAPFVLLFVANAPWNMTAALIVFCLAAATDFADGRIARSRGEISALGAALDPIADKLLVLAALVLLVRNGVISGVDVMLVIAILSREVLVSGLREALAASGNSLQVTRMAKWKTTAQLVSCGGLIAAAPTGPLGVDWLPIARLILWIAGALTLWTGAAYVAAATPLLNRNH